MNVIIVGNSDQVLREQNGKIIDGFDYVVRLNRAPIKGYEQYVGTETTSRFLNKELFLGQWQRGQVEHPLEECEGLIWSYVPLSDEDFSNLYPVADQLVCYGRNEWMEILANHDIEVNASHNASIGLQAICQVIQFRECRVFIYGIETEYREQYGHYWEDRKRLSTFHKWAYEKHVIQQLIKKGLIQELKWDNQTEADKKAKLDDLFPRSL